MSKIEGTILEQKVIWDRDSARTMPMRGFKLFLRSNLQTLEIPLPNAINLADARRLSREMGYNPTQWICKQNGAVQINKFY